MNNDHIHDSINQLLPQWQCERCQYHGCEAYAHAIVVEGVAINRCPPGGEVVLKQLQHIAKTFLGRSLTEIESQSSIDPNLSLVGNKTIAKIDPQVCIGCARCLPVCPLGAIVGGKRALHRVIEANCSGCALCLPVCPMDCIDFAIEQPWQSDDPRQINYLQAMRRLGRIKSRRSNSKPSPQDTAPLTANDRKSTWLKAQLLKAQQSASAQLAQENSF